MLPQRKKFSCLGARPLPVPKYNLANASRTHLRSNGELGKLYSSRQKSFQKVSQSVVFVGIIFSKRTLIVRRNGFSLLCFSPDRALKSALFARRQATDEKLCWRFLYKQRLRVVLRKFTGVLVYVYVRLVKQRINSEV